MPEVLSNLIIQSVDVLHALRKWDGRDFVLNNGTSIERRWKATDREFLKMFSCGEITESVLARFAANNNNENPSKRTGGYSITRKFWDGLSSWTPRIRYFFVNGVKPARLRFHESGDIEILWDLIYQLSKMEGRSAKGYTNPLGVVAASKLLYFACPEMPVFIYDSVVGKALSVPNLVVEDYFHWWAKYHDIRNMNSSALSLLPSDRRQEFSDKDDWFTRRSIDLMLYRFGQGGSYPQKDNLSSC
jgi:hypothetical protein